MVRKLHAVHDDDAGIARYSPLEITHHRLPLSHSPASLSVTVRECSESESVLEGEGGMGWGWVLLFHFRTLHTRHTMLARQLCFSVSSLSLSLSEG